MSVAINIDRLLRRVFELGQIGALSGGGCKRLALTPEDATGRALVTGWFREIGLEAHSDVIGNTWAIRPDGAGRTDAAPVVMGSHIDTVGTGGLYDGVLGVLGALEVIESLNDAGIETDRPIAVAFFTNEEGARFAPDMMGSGVAQGGLDLEEMLATTGIDGVTVGAALDAIGARGSERVGALAPAAYLELHIEQGPVLDRQGVPVGIVDAITGLFKWQITLTGVSNHAGTTPMKLRTDAFMGLTEFATQIERVLAEHGSPASVATIGRVELFPGAANVVPGQAVFSLDVRDTDAAVLADLGQSFRRTLAAIARRRGLMFDFETLSEIAPVPCAKLVRHAVEQSVEALGISATHINSGAAHDAQVIAAVAPAGMIFVPSKEGRSHSAAEWTAWNDIEAGANVLLNTLKRLAS